MLTRGYAELSGYDALIARNRAIERHVLPKLTPGLWEMLIFHEVSRARAPKEGALSPRVSARAGLRPPPPSPPVLFNPSP